MKRKILLIGAAVLLIGGILLDQVTATRSSLPPVREGQPQPARPQPGDPTFSKTPIAPTYAERRQMLLDWARDKPTSEERGGIFTDLVKLAAGAIEHPSATALQNALDFVNQRLDTSDFTLAGLVRLYYLHGADGALLPAQAEAIHQALLHYKYWMDAPGQSLNEFWTENHQALSLGAEYLAGQAFPDETFYDGQTGRQHMLHANTLLLRWLDYHARTGMAEWDSIPYYNMELAALLNLVDFVEDQQLQMRATMMVDLLLFDAIVDSFYGQYATSHGRATADTAKSAAGDSILTVKTLLFGLGRLQSIDMATAALVTSPRYQVPPVLQALALDNPDEYMNYERHSIPLDAKVAAQYGLSFDDMNDVSLWWGMGAFSNPEVINLTVNAADRYNLWHYPDFKDLKDVAGVLKPLGLLPLASRLLKPDPNGVVLSEVNKLTYRTPDGALSTAQSYRPGEKGYQQHIWRATLGPYATVFVTNPDSLRSDDKHRPSYWASNGRLPRNAQYKNVLISIYNIDRHPSLKMFEPRHYGFTHAYFPKWAFDEVKEVPAAKGGGWVFGRSGDGYVALYSHLPYQWITSGPDAGQEIVAPGLQNVWICQIGRKAVDGSFDEFIKAISTAPLAIHGLRVEYTAPGVGKTEFAWQGELHVNGDPIPLDGYPRWDNPYLKVEFGTRKFNIAFNDMSLVLDFEQGTRIFR